MSVPPDPNSSPEELFESFVEGGVEDFKAFLAKYPQHAEGLQELYERREQVARELEESLMTESFLHRSTRLGDGPFASAFRVTEGMVIGDYRVLRLLGRGGMGEVWEAEQASLSRRVALKLLLPEHVDQKGLEFFAREARAGGRLSHPGIVAIHGTGEDEGLHWIAMELVEEACDLRRSMDAMRDEDELPEDYYRHVAEFIAEAAEALEVAHDSGVIHRDLKPGNILVTSEDRPKISDFGLAKLTDELSISLAGDLVGTYYYMSPEQVAAKRIGLDHRTDVFSLGVVLYEMLTLVRPFEGDTTEQVAHKIMMVDPPSAKDVRSKVPRDLAVICGKAIEKNRDRRYVSMGELAADLRRHLANEPILAKPTGVLVRLGKWISRNPTKSLAGGVAAAALVAISVLYVQLMEEQGATAQALETASEERDLKTDALEQVQAEKAATQVALDQVEEEKTATAAALVTAETERDRAKEAETEAAEQRDEAAQRAEELQQVSDFQAEQLSAVNPQAMGIAIRTMVLERARDAGERAGRESDVLDEKQAELMRLLAGTDFTGIARGVLDEQIFKGALEALKDFEEQPLVQAQLLQVVGETLHELGFLERALEPKEQALEIHRRELGDEHPSTLASVSNLGNLFRSQGKYDDAEQLFSEGLERCRRMLGDDGPSIWAFISNLGGVLMEQGKYAEAETLYREALEGCRRTLGDEHPSTLSSINNLGTLLQARGKYTEAELLLREALEANRRMYGDEDSETLVLANNLGVLFQEQDRYAEAEPLLRESLEGRRRIFGDEHPNTLTVMGNLGLLVYRLGKVAEAERLLNEALEGCRRTFANEHPTTLLAMNNMSGLLVEGGRFSEAEPLLREALEAQRRTLGDENSETLMSINTMALLLDSQGEHTEAELLFREVMEVRRRKLGDEHPSTWSAINNLGLVLMNHGKHVEAEPLLREVLELIRSKLGDEHPDTLGSLNNLGLLLQHQDKYSEAEPLLRDLLEVRRRTLGDDHPDTLDVINNLGVTLYYQKNYTEAEPLMREALEVRRRIFGDEHSETLQAKQNLDAVLSKLNEAETPPTEDSDR